MVEAEELLERDREQQILNDMIKRAAAGNGTVAVVQGPAGIGKTSLLAATRTVAVETGMDVLTARGSDLERDFSYGVVRQLLEPALARIGPAERVTLLAGVAEQAGLVFGPPPQQGAPAVDVSFATLHGLYWLIADLCGRRPLLLSIDDLHWIDSPSLRFLTYLLPRVDGLPLLLLTGLRTGETSDDPGLLSHLVTDPETQVLDLRPLTEAASVQLVRRVLTPGTEEAFCRACHATASGNPLLVRQLAEVAAAEGHPPTATTVADLSELGQRVVGGRLALRLTRLGPAASALCSAVAVMGVGCQLRHAAQLAGLDYPQALASARQLIRADILSHSGIDQTGSLGAVGFVHPLMRSAAYGGLAEEDRLNGHAHAARLLAEAGEPAEKVAAHLMFLPPQADSWVVEQLRQAAKEALLRGSPDSAMSYLERCVKEPPPTADRAEILAQLGTAAQLVDMTKAADYLSAAMAAAGDPDRRAALAEMLAGALHFVGRTRDAVALLTAAIEALPERSDRRAGMEALLLGVAFLDPGLRELIAGRISRLRDSPMLSRSGPGAHGLALVVALTDALEGTSRSLIAASVDKALADGSLIEAANPTTAYGIYLLTVLESPRALPLADSWVAAARRQGSMLALPPALCYRGVALLAQGELADAEADIREARWASQLSSHHIGRPILAAYHAECLLEQGRTAEAEGALRWCGQPEPLPRTGYWYWLMYSWALLLSAQGRPRQAADMMLAAGRRFASHGGQNPAMLPWRSGAALALHALGRRDEAISFAEQELELAHAWSAPATVGRSLRIAGVVRGGDDGRALLGEAERVLADTTAKLEHAKALVDLGAAYRRAGQRQQARQYLRAGLTAAHAAGATPLIERGLAELRAAGGRLTKSALDGPAALTPSEERVARLAAAGHSNRQIAQTLFITTNTVEVHLTRIYRKLDTGRSDLAARLELLTTDLVR
jgi:DNA-binding CsgD family transcriptional regulator